jgi:beta-N-acetylhexosaminidase
MRALGALAEPALTRRCGELLGRQLAALGITMDLAPVLDVDTNPNNPVIGDRSFGQDPQTVIAQAGAFAQGLGAGGVLRCGKHFPGHGDTDLDSHLALPRLGHDRARLDAVELAPFRALCGELDAILTAHVIFEAVAPDQPATLAPRVVRGILRRELGFSGLVLSDDMEMKAIADHFGVEQAAIAAIEAGCDQLLICSRLEWRERAHAALCAKADSDEAFKRLLADAAERAISVRKRRVPAPCTNERELTARLCPEETRALEAELAARLADQA